MDVVTLEEAVQADLAASVDARIFTGAEPVKETEFEVAVVYLKFPELIVSVSLAVKPSRYI